MQIFPAARAAPGGPGRSCAAGFSSQLLHAVPTEGYVVSHFHYRLAQLILLPPAPFVTQANFPGRFQAQKVCFTKGSTRLLNSDGLKYSTHPGTARDSDSNSPCTRGAVGPRRCVPVAGTVPQPCRFGRSFALSNKSQRTLGGHTANSERGLDPPDTEGENAALGLVALGKAHEKK